MRMPKNIPAVIILLEGRLIAIDFKFMSGKILAIKSIITAPPITQRDATGAFFVNDQAAPVRNRQYVSIKMRSPLNVICPRLFEFCKVNIKVQGVTVLFYHQNCQSHRINMFVFKITS